LNNLALSTHAFVKDIVYWLAKIMAHRNYYFDHHQSNHHNKKYYKDLQPDEKKRFDMLIQLFIEITPTICIGEHTLPSVFEFVKYEKQSTKTKRTPPTEKQQMKYMQSCEFEAVRKHFRGIGNSNAISTHYLGMQFWTEMERHKSKLPALKAWGRNLDFEWLCIENPDPELPVLNKKDDQQPITTETLCLKKYKWDKDPKDAKLQKITGEARYTEVNGQQAQTAWTSGTVPLPIAIIFNQLQGYRNDETTVPNKSNRGIDEKKGEQSSPNRAYDYRFVSEFELKLLARDFPSCLDPVALIKMNDVHKVPFTNKGKAEHKEANEEATQNGKQKPKQKAGKKQSGGNNKNKGKKNQGKPPSNKKQDKQTSRNNKPKRKEPTSSGCDVDDNHINNNHNHTYDDLPDLSDMEDWETNSEEKKEMEPAKRNYTPIISL
jgi:hypothetical protein